MKYTSLTSCFQLHDRKKRRQTHTGSVLQERLLFQNLIEMLGGGRQVTKGEEGECTGEKAEA